MNAPLNNYQDTHTVIRTYFNDIWLSGPYQDIDLVWPNVDYNAGPNDYWVRFAINDGDGFVATMGPSPIRRYLGIVSIQIFAPQKLGDGELRRMADFVSDAFINFKHPYLFFKTPTIRDIGYEQERWYQLNLVIEFERTSTGEKTDE